jgi:hypothetical protein
MRFRIIGTDGFSHVVEPAIHDDDLVGWRSLLRARGVEGLENARIVAGARTGDQTEKKVDVPGEPGVRVSGSLCSVGPLAG